jgi:hypothetical protein
LINLPSGTRIVPGHSRAIGTSWRFRKGDPPQPGLKSPTSSEKQKGAGAVKKAIEQAGLKGGRVAPDRRGTGQYRRGSEIEDRRRKKPSRNEKPPELFSSRDV